MIVRCQQRNPVWWVTLAPEAGRDTVALELAGLSALAETLVAVDADEACRVVVIESACAGVFCHGMDLGQLARADATAGVDVPAALERYGHVLLALRSLRAATVCVVDGSVMGGGVGLAAAADVVLASARASFTLPELMWGLVPAMVLPALRERLAPAVIRGMALTGARVDAARAHALGLVDILVATDDALEPALRRQVLRPLLRARPAAVAALKELVTRTRSLDFADTLERGFEQTAADAGAAEVLDAIRAFSAHGEAMPWFARPPKRPRCTEGTA